MLGDNRFMGYVAVEALAWWMYAKDISERSARESAVQGTRTRSRARRTSRRRFPTAEWSYYEWMRD